MIWELFSGGEEEFWKERGILIPSPKDPIVLLIVIDLLTEQFKGAGFEVRAHPLCSRCMKRFFYYYYYYYCYHYYYYHYYYYRAEPGSSRVPGTQAQHGHNPSWPVLCLDHLTHLVWQLLYFRSKTSSCKKSVRVEHKLQNN